MQNLFQPVEKPGEIPKFGRAAKGMSREYAEGLRDHKKAIFEDFQCMISLLDKAFPDYGIAVRPHSTESQEIYHRIAARCKRVIVTNEGNVVPRLLAAKALVHNSCTTGVEAYVMRVPAITYRKSNDETYDIGFYRLPNLTSHPCFTLDERIASLKNIFNGSMGPAGGDDRKRLVEKYLAARKGPLACERMVDVLAKIAKDQSKSAKPGIGARISSWSLFAVRTMIKRYKDSRPGSHNRPEFQHHRYPEVSMNDMQERVARFQQLLGSSSKLKVERFLNQFFRIKV